LQQYDRSQQANNGSAAGSFDAGDGLDASAGGDKYSIDSQVRHINRRPRFGGKD